MPPKNTPSNSRPSRSVVLALKSANAASGDSRSTWFHGEIHGDLWGFNGDFMVIYGGVDGDFMVIHGDLMVIWMVIYEDLMVISAISVVMYREFDGDVDGDVWGVNGDFNGDVIHGDFMVIDCLISWNFIGI